VRSVYAGKSVHWTDFLTRFDAQDNAAKQIVRAVPATLVLTGLALNGVTEEKKIPRHAMQQAGHLNFRVEVLPSENLSAIHIA